MAAIDINELIPAPTDHTKPVPSLPEHLGTANVEFDQDDYGRPLTTVTLEHGEHAGRYVYIWTEDGNHLASSHFDPDSGLPNARDNADLTAYALALHANYDRLLSAAVWNLLGNTDFVATLSGYAKRAA